jgi:putative DNA primase/helicase
MKPKLLSEEISFSDRCQPDAIKVNPHLGRIELPTYNSRTDIIDDESVPPEFTDEALALAFSEQYADRLRYTATWGKWQEWTGKRWEPDTTLMVFDLARKICRNAASRAAAGMKVKAAVAAKCADARSVAAVERLARADRRHAATTDIWDSNPWLLNTPDGFVDLQTGKMHHHRSDLYMTKITAVGPGGYCPNWLRVLDRALNGDPELVAFLKRVLGYCLTGITRDHALFFTYGTGGNGKGVVVNNVVGIMGGYATVAPMETFTASNGDRHPTDLAGLRGARLVTAQETEEGRQWAESKIKSMTGGDRISARFMRQDFFEFTPEFKLLVAGNHKPGLRNVDEAMRRRFHLIPFIVTIPESERDPTLPEKLRDEWPGILKWMIEGCLEWQRDGLAPPAAVADATTEYLEAEDSFATWIDDHCTTQSGAFETSADLFMSWKSWADRAGEHAGSQKRFADKMQSKGFKKARRHGGGRGFADIALYRPNYTEEGRNGG